MEIQKVQSNGKSFKVVVGLPFDVQALSPDPPKPPYKWSLGTGDKFNFESYWLKDVQSDKLNTQLTIPFFALPKDNRDFGPVHGTLKVTDSDYRQGYSTDPKPNQRV